MVVILSRPQCVNAYMQQYVHTEADECLVSSADGVGYLIVPRAITGIPPRIIEYRPAVYPDILLSDI